jgi:hypothetical protein
VKLNGLGNGLLSLCKWCRFQLEGRYGLRLDLGLGEKRRHLQERLS